MECSKCKKNKFFKATTTYENGSELIQIKCGNCGYSDKEKTIELSPQIFDCPALFVMPFGRHKEKHLFEASRDRSYLIWASNKIENEKIKNTIKEFLKPVGFLWEEYEECKS